MEETDHKAGKDFRFKQALEKQLRKVLGHIEERKDEETKGFG